MRSQPPTVRNIAYGRLNADGKFKVERMGAAVTSLARNSSREATRSPSRLSTGLRPPDSAQFEKVSALRSVCLKMARSNNELIRAATPNARRLSERKRQSQLYRLVVLNDLGIEAL